MVDLQFWREGHSVRWSVQEMLAHLEIINQFDLLKEYWTFFVQFLFELSLIVLQSDNCPLVLEILGEFHIRNFDLYRKETRDILISTKENREYFEVWPRGYFWISLSNIDARIKYQVFNKRPIQRTIKRVPKNCKQQNTCGSSFGWLNREV